MSDDFEAVLEDYLGKGELTDESLASAILKIRMGISYEVWVKLHKVKGDWIE